MMKKAVELKTKDYWYYEKLAKYYYLRQDLANSLAVINSFIASAKPDDENLGLAHYSSGWYLNALGRKSEARNEAAVACKLGHKQSCRLAR